MRKLPCTRRISYPIDVPRVPVGFTLVADSDDKIARAYQVKTMPSGYVLDRKGRVRHVHEGFRSNSAEQIEAQIIELLKEPA